MADFYCPDCHNLLERESGCGSVSYFCNTCRTIVSRSKMLDEQQLKAATPPQADAEKKWWED